MTLSVYFMSKSVFTHYYLTQSVRLSKIIARKVTNIDPYYMSDRNVGQWL